MVPIFRCPRTSISAWVCLAGAFGHLEEDFPAWVLPPLSVGSSEEHMRLPGTLSLAPETLSRIIYQYGAALSACGVRRLVLSNSHGGNRPALQSAGLRLRRKHGLLVVKVSYFEFPPPENRGASGLGVAPWTTRRRIGDGDDAPFVPGFVRLEEIRDAHPLGAELETTMRRLTPEGAASFSWLAEDINRTGVAGNARQADAAKGKLLVAYYGEVLAEVIRDAKAFPLEQLA